LPALSLEEIPSIVRTINVVPAGIVAALAHEIVINNQTSAGAKESIRDYLLDTSLAWC
jgi:hypothetical protein